MVLSDINDNLYEFEIMYPTDDGDYINSGIPAFDLFDSTESNKKRVLKAIPANKIQYIVEGKILKGEIK
jgi:hypothetical protein